MAKLFLHVDGAYSIAQKLAGKGVTYPMQLHVPDSGLCQYSLENPSDEILFHRLTITDLPQFL
jgi:hypothetical protein